MIPPRYFALIPAAGVGARMGASMPKQYARVAGKPMLRHVLDTFAETEAITHTFAVVSGNDAYIEEVMHDGPALAGRVTIVRDGGASRRESVLNGLLAMRPQVADDEWVLVHDAARPCIDRELVEQFLDEVGDDPIGGLLAMPLADTLKSADENLRVAATIPRINLWRAQTPQMFRYELLRRGLDRRPDATDEAQAVESVGYNAPRLVQGENLNIKVTFSEDLQLAEMILARQGRAAA